MTGVLRELVHIDGASRPFGTLTTDEVRWRAQQLRSVGGWGPTARVVPVALAWAELARTMEAACAETVADLGDEEAAARAGSLWVVPPGGSLLPSG